jgi:predicted SnoaL-like aldol condensation-catalyzing enzyme
MSQESLQGIQSASAPLLVIERMIRALNLHDLESMVACFAPDFRSEQPFHPERNFTGRAEVHRNWSSFFKMTPDIQVEILNEAAEGDIVWAELHYHGTNTDGTQHRVRGVTLSGIQNNQINWSRLYVEPVQA